MNLRFSLFSKIMLWFFLNLLLLGAILWLIFNFRFDSRSRFFESSNRIESLTRAIESETNRKSRAERDEILNKYTETYGVEFFLFDYMGKQLGGREIVLPAEVFNEITRPEPQFLHPREQPNPIAPREQKPPPRPPMSVYIRTTESPRYWFVGRIMTAEPDKPEGFRSRVIAASHSFTGNGLFFDATPYLVVTGVIVGFSILFWLPFVRGITRAVGQMTNAAEQIADEQFDVRVSEKRTDEIGRLGKAINNLAGRLSNFVTGQKRFLGDISHELNSPLGRLQFALSMIEIRGGEDVRLYVEDAKEEVELMAKLVRELLAYSKAGIKATEIRLEQVQLRPLVERVIEREAGQNAEIKIEIAENLEVSANPELLSRALANIVRNAIRYAADAGTITISAQIENNHVRITVADNGAGVPESEIERLFEPFYRIESDRARETGGTGLGLAIVKSCIEACGGKVSARNRAPSGFEVIILLKR